MTHCIYLRHISKKNFMKISQVVIELWDVQEWKRHKISIKQENAIPLKWNFFKITISVCNTLSWPLYICNNFISINDCNWVMVVTSFFKIFKGNSAIKGEQSFMCGTHCLDLRNIHFYKISSQLFTDRRTGPCHMVSLFSKQAYNKWLFVLKLSNGAKIRNRYNQVPHLTQDTNGKVTNSQKTPQTRAKRSALSQQVTTKHI